VLQARHADALDAARDDYVINSPSESILLEKSMISAFHKALAYRSFRIPRWRVLRAAICLAAMPSAVVAQAVSGRVTDATGEPLAAVTLLVERDTVRAITGDDGTYRIARLRAGTHVIVTRRFGYAPERRTVTVGASDVTLNIQLTAVATSLEAVVTTATGQQRRIELGNTVSAVDIASRVQTSPVKSIGDLLNAQAPGVQVISGNYSGTAPRVRIRGQSSTQLNNDPIYIIDGIRMTSTSGGGVVSSGQTGGGSVVSRINDINPEDIESIEIVKGPSAATLYGTDAANGVVVISTKRGRAGPPQWAFHAERGRLEDRNDYPGRYSLFGHLAGTAASVQRQCSSSQVAQNKLDAAQGCIVDSTGYLNMWEVDDLTPLKPGARSTLGGQVSGGAGDTRYFLSGDWITDNGTLGQPDFDQRRWDSLGVSLEKFQKRPNYYDQRSFRANINSAIGSKFDLAVSSGFSAVDLGLPRTESPGANGLFVNSQFGFGSRNWRGIDGVPTNGYGYPLNGWGFETPGMYFLRRAQQVANRFIASSTGNWRPLGWLSVSGDLGFDLTDRRDRVVQRFGQQALIGFGTAIGTGGAYAIDARSRTTNFTGNLRGTATWQPRSWAQLRSSAGLQTVAFNSNGITGQGLGLPPGGEAPSQATTFTISAFSTPSRTVGLYLEEQLAIRDRLYLTGAVRTDKNSAFGQNLDNIYYPKASLSWIASEEGFFPSVPLLNQLRVRASLGTSGVQPGATQSIRTYTAISGFYRGTTASGLQLNNPGNPDLEPERSTEFEGGFDSRWWDDRLSVELTYYRKKTTNGLVQQQVPPSAGVNSFFVNLGGIENKGIEYRLSAQLLDTRDYGFELTFSGSNNKNKILALGSVVSTITAGTPINQVGRPINSFFVRPITWNDGNGDGLLAVSEVTVGTTPQFLGPQLPPTQMALSARAELFGRRLRLSALVDRKAGGYQFVGDYASLCAGGFASAPFCNPLGRLDSPLEEQARAVAGTGRSTPDGYVEAMDFIKLREVSATYDFGEGLASRLFRAKGASISAGGRNLAMWLKEWSGVDPEAVVASNGDAVTGVFSAGVPTFFTIRFNINY
jgi:TonB-linked SusC/RagA family outer membrane protein